jgi:DNA-binding FadR family transcriptional regulator
MTPADLPSRDRLAQRSKRAITRSSKVSQTVAMAILDEIIEEGLQPGDRLPTEATMLEEFDVGRASIREGLRILEIYGLIEIRQGQRGGPIVSELNARDLGRSLTFFFHTTGATYGELLEARLLIEPAMARLAAERQDPKLLTELQATMEREAAAPAEDYLDCANMFHYIVAGASGNRVLDLLGRSMRGLYADRLTADGIFPDEGRPKIRNLHSKIGALIIAGNGPRAEKLMREHLLELAELQTSKTPWIMDERVKWRG